MPIDYDEARAILDEAFHRAEGDVLESRIPDVVSSKVADFDAIFESNTQAYREVLLGCLLARIQDKQVDIRLPYVGHGPTAFNGRTLDERVVNPFFYDNHIPSSKGPYLSTFRRSVKYDAATGKGLRDQRGYQALLDLLSSIEGVEDDRLLFSTLHYLLYRFAELREEFEVHLLRIQRISLQQYDDLLSRLLNTQSGGRFPVILVVAAFQTIKQIFQLDWDISFQGINVADSATRSGADITVSRDHSVVLAAEVTERPLDQARVVSTFNTKIAPNGIEDYLFLHRGQTLSENARIRASQYFAQGHEVNFIHIKEWIQMTLVTIGVRGRTLFNRAIIELLDDRETPRAVRVAWNLHVAEVLGGSRAVPAAQKPTDRA